MELSALSQNIVMVPLKRGDEVLGETILELHVNIDAFTPQFFRALRARTDERMKLLQAEFAAALRESQQPVVQGIRKKKKPTKAEARLQAEAAFKQQMEDQLESFEGQARRLETMNETNIEFLLPDVLKGWDVVQDGQPVALTKEVLMTLPPKLIQEIFDVSMKAARTVKKRVDQDEDEATSDNTTAGFRELRAVGQST